MSNSGQRPSLPVCFIEQNPLGLEFLASLVRNDSSLDVLTPTNLSREKIRAQALLIFVIDNTGLPLPLSACLRLLRANFPNAKYVVLDRELPQEELLRLLWNKIDGFLTYEELSKSLLAAIHAVADGRIWMPREILREYVQWGQRLRHGDHSGPEQMTSRESQIIELVKRRFSNKEIAEILRIRECTVKFHLSNVFSKLQVAGRRDLIETTSDFSSLGALFRSLTQAASEP